VRLYLSSAGVGDRPERLVELLRGGRPASRTARSTTARRWWSAPPARARV